MQHSWADFGRTTSALHAELPARLIHSNVEQTARAAAFSAERKHPVFVVDLWAWHQHANRSATDRCRYVACENALLMQNLNAALREEAR